MTYESHEATPARIYLQPLAAPSILGLYGFAAATFMIAAHYAGWYGTDRSSLFLFPFAAMLGGIAQFLAGMWAFKARDGLATAVHGVWGSFFIAFGFLNLMFANGTLARPTGLFPEMGYWFIVLAAITWICCWAALAENVALFIVLLTLAAGSTLEAIGMLTGSLGALQIAAGYLLIISSICAWYTASALLLAESFGHRVLGVGQLKASVETPMPATAEPGVARGQEALVMRAEPSPSRV